MRIYRSAKSSFFMNSALYLSWYYSCIHFKRYFIYLVYSGLWTEKQNMGTAALYICIHVINFNLLNDLKSITWFNFSSDSWYGFPFRFIFKQNIWNQSAVNSIVMNVNIWKLNHSYALEDQIWIVAFIIYYCFHY